MHFINLSVLFLYLSAPAFADVEAFSGHLYPVTICGTVARSPIQGLPGDNELTIKANGETLHLWGTSDSVQADLDAVQPIAATAGCVYGKKQPYDGVETRLFDVDTFSFCQTEESCHKESHGRNALVLKRLLRRAGLPNTGTLVAPIYAAEAVRCYAPAFANEHYKCTIETQNKTFKITDLHARRLDFNLRAAGAPSYNGAAGGYMTVASQVSCGRVFLEACELWTIDAPRNIPGAN